MAYSNVKQDLFCILISSLASAGTNVTSLSISIGWGILKMLFRKWTTRKATEEHHDS